MILTLMTLHLKSHFGPTLDADFTLYVQGRLYVQSHSARNHYYPILTIV